MVATSELIAYQTLRTPFRQEFIKRVLEPLTKCLALVGRRFEVNRQNVQFKNTLTLMGIFDKFFELENNPSRKPMFEGAAKIFLYKEEVDNYYQDRFGWFVEELIKAILRGDFQERTNGQPSAPNWLEQGNYGGKYSIIKALQKKEVLEALEKVGAKW